jgi:hypothetical protein
VLHDALRLYDNQQDLDLLHPDYLLKVATLAALAERQILELEVFEIACGAELFSKTPPCH